MNKDKLLEPEQLTDLLDQVISDTREIISDVLQDDIANPGHEYAIYPNTCNNLDHAREGDGYCGHVQTIIKSQLEDMGYKVDCYTIQSLEGKTDYNHVALTFSCETREGKRTYLIDPTFKQFDRGQENSPGILLANLPDGEYMREALTQRGFLELTPERGESYLASFCRGISPFQTSEGVMDYLTNSQDARSHMLWPAREYFIEKGWMDESSTCRAPLMTAKKPVRPSQPTLGK